METKTCTKCGKTKPVTSFCYRNKAKGIRHTSCVECGKKFRQAHYKKNKSYYNDKARARNKVLVKENVRKVWSYLESHPCIDCQETDPTVLQFDHVRGKKKAAVSALIHRYKWETIQAEIDKCEVRCANCHIRKTAKERGWYMSLD